MPGIRAPYKQPVETPMPSLDPPGDELCHLRVPSDDGALCGAKGGKHEGHGKFYPEDPVCTCGTPICPTCRAIARVENRTGIRP